MGSESTVPPRPIRSLVLTCYAICKHTGSDWLCVLWFH